MRLQSTIALSLFAILWHLPAVELPDPSSVEHPQGAAVPAASPTSYPDGEGFQQRARLVLEGVADNNLETWRRGYFSGGDPGKYLPGHAMAKLLIGQDDPNIRRLYNDDRSVREHYHFAALNWARFLPLYGNDILSDEKRKELAERAASYTAYIDGGGTENHVTQWLTSANVLPHYLEGGRLARRDQARALAEAKSWLQNYIKGIYAGGNGEWDSSTYIMFTMNGLLNIYDFSPDEKTRLLARAGLDWFATAYALKYRQGIFTAPLQRGFADRPHATVTDETGFVWFGSRAPITSQHTRGWRYTLHVITSAWRPNAVLVNLARKENLDLPVSFVNRKPNYWGTKGNPRPGRYFETLYLAENYSLGVLWNGHGSQISRMSLVVETEDGAVAVHGGHPRQSDHNGNKTGIGFADGTSRYTQFAHAQSSVIALSLAPDNEEHAYSYFRLPAESTMEQHSVGDKHWWTLAIGETTVAVLPITQGEEAPAVVTQGEGRRAATFLKIPGQRSGFILQVLDDGVEALNQVTVDLSSLDSDLRIGYTNVQGTQLVMTFNPDPDNDRHANRMAQVTIDGEVVEGGSGPVYDGPFVHQENGILSVNDGKQGFIIDFSGDLPEYREWTPPQP